MNIVIVGGGLAAAHTATALRENGHTGGVTVLAGERHLPYERPPLSKAVLLGTDEPASATVHPQEWYREHDVDLRTGTTVDALDLDAGEVRAGSEVFAFDKLVLATGSHARHLALADDLLVHAPRDRAEEVAAAMGRTLEDSAALKQSFGPDRRIVIIGAGWIGLEVAAAARAAGTTVTVVESLDLPLLRVLGPEVATTFADLHRARLM